MTVEYCHVSHRIPSNRFVICLLFRVVRAGDIAVKKYPWTFKIVNLANPDCRKYFAAGCEREMKVSGSYLKMWAVCVCVCVCVCVFVC